MGPGSGTMSAPEGLTWAVALNLSRKEIRSWSYDDVFPSGPLARR